MEKYKFKSINRFYTSLIITIIGGVLLVVGDYETYKAYFDQKPMMVIASVIGIVLGVIFTILICYLVISAIIYAIYLIRKQSIIEGSIIIGTFFLVFLYIYFVFIQNDIFNGMIPITNQPNYPTFMEYVGIIGAITIPFLLLLFTNNANETREEFRLQKLYESFYQCIIMDNGFIVEPRNNNTREALKEFLKQKKHNIVELKLKYNNKDWNSNHVLYFGVELHNVGSHLDIVDLDSIKCKFKDGEYILENCFTNQNLIIPSNNSFSLIFDIDRRSDLKFTLSFVSVNNIGIRYKHSFIIDEYSKFTNYSKEIIYNFKGGNFE